MLIKNKTDISSSEITPESIYLRRREFMRASFIGSAALAVGPHASAEEELSALNFEKSANTGANGFTTDESLTPFSDVKRYNNFYEFGMGKGDPAKHAASLTTVPWSVAIEGEIAKPGNYQLEDILSWVDLEERIYRLRCVEAWSMVVPWVGILLGANKDEGRRRSLFWLQRG